MPDGKIKVIIDDGIPTEHHVNAEEFLNFVQGKCGGERKQEKLAEGLIHHEEHEHGHEHHKH